MPRRGCRRAPCSYQVIVLPRLAFGTVFVKRNGRGRSLVMAMYSVMAASRAPVPVDTVADLLFGERGKSSLHEIDP